MGLATRAIALAGAAVGCVLLACSAVIGVQGYRPCSGAECDGDAATDGPAPEAPPGDVPTSSDGGVPCQTSNDCTLPAPVCSHGACAGVTALARGMSGHFCVILTDETLVCWGANDQGQAGVGNTAAHVPPTPVLDHVVQARTGVDQTCALTDDGSVYCWGLNATGGNTTKPARVSLPNQMKATSISVGMNDACAQLSDTSVWCWGDNHNGEIGCAGMQPGSCGDAAVPVGATTQMPAQLAAPGTVDHYGIGGYSSCTLKSSLDCFGYGDRLGVDAQTPFICCGSASPTIQGASTLNEVQATDVYVCVHDDLGDWYCWGENFRCVIPNVNCGGNVYTPVQLQLPEQVRLLAAGWKHACGRASSDDTKVFCWGDNTFHSVDPNSNAVMSPPTYVRGLHGHIVDLAAYRETTCALQDDGEVVCWGANGDWLLGHEGTTDVLMPSPVQWP